MLYYLFRGLLTGLADVLYGGSIVIHEVKIENYGEEAILFFRVYRVLTLPHRLLLRLWLLGRRHRKERFMNKSLREILQPHRT